MTDQISFAPLRALDRNGDPVAGAKASFFLTGTTTPQTVYSDQAGTVPHPSPLVADGRGIFPQVFSNATLKGIVTDPAGAVLPGFPIDPLTKTQITAAGASGITFNPTAGIPVDDVQTAIERVQDNIGTAGKTFGVGTTGDAAVISNLDATDTPAGQYRVSATTVGVFPAGMAAVDGGVVEFARQTAAGAVQMLYHGATARKASRSLIAGVWSAWRESLSSDQTLVAGDVFYHNGSNVARLPKGAAGQSLVMNAGVTAPEWGSPFKNLYESPVTTIALNTLYTFTHGLGELPKMMQAYYVCKSATNGYEIGDYVPILQGTENYNSNVSPAMILSATQIKVRIASNALMESIGIDGTTRSNYLPADFDLVVRAWI